MRVSIKWLRWPFTDGGVTMQNVFLFAILVVLSACATTPADLRKRPASIELSSSRSAKIVALCIADRWEAADWSRLSEGSLGAPPTYPLSITMRPIANGYFVFVKGGTLDHSLADVTNTANGSMTKYFYRGMERSYPPAMAEKNGIESAIRDCQ